VEPVPNVGNVFFVRFFEGPVAQQDRRWVYLDEAWEGSKGVDCSCPAQEVHALHVISLFYTSFPLCSCLIGATMIHLCAQMCMLQCEGLGVCQRMSGAAISWCKATEPHNTFCCPRPVPASRTPPAADATERLEAVLGGLVDVDVIMGTMPGAIRKAVAASSP
jgi:hypothetical protein